VDNVKGGPLSGQLAAMHEAKEIGWSGHKRSKKIQQSIENEVFMA
jgi:hypothetical protein